MLGQEEKAHYYFKLKHDIQNDSELVLAEFEIKSLMDKQPETIRNFVDDLCMQPLNDFLSTQGVRVQDIITRLPYCGDIQGYHVQADVRNCMDLISRLAYFREFYVLILSKDIEMARKIYTELKGVEDLTFDKSPTIYNISPYAQMFTIQKDQPKILFRFIPFHVLYEPSHYACQLARTVTQADRMYKASILHFQKNFYRPYSPSSARWFKTIEDFIDERDAPQLYLTHYIGVKGKFFPRMVRAITNGIKMKEGELLLDPMCGSGTMNLEAVLCGINTIGVDFHPLFTNITKIKIDSLKWDIEWLRKEIEGLLRDIRLNVEAYTKNKTLSSYMVEKQKAVEVFIPKSLRKGVNEDSLHCIEIIKGCIRDLKNKELQQFCELALAYWIRSMLKKQTIEKIIETYSQRLWSMFFSLYYFWKFKHEVQDLKLGKHLVYTGDVRELEKVIKPGMEYFGKHFVDAIITSPPYGTAIDYLNEHVYALYALDLTKDHLKLDEEHIGSPRVQARMVGNIISKSDDFLTLPTSAQSVLMRMVKFGRKVKAAALYKYFVDMFQAFRQMHNVLAPDKFLVMIIGKEQTIKLGAENGIIDLGAIMEEMGKSVGLMHLHSIDIGLRKASERGAIPTEHVIFFKKAH
ncbi:MAG: hypothetical protein QMD13_07140 [Candidatus Bathyarchaeia archaeon]|nr:hypothetical protein [Candidatus Bathyarchaeia archaeon]